MRKLDNRAKIFLRSITAELEFKKVNERVGNDKKKIGAILHLQPAINDLVLMIIGFQTAVSREDLDNDVLLIEMDAISDEKLRIVRIIHETLDAFESTLN